ncbi:MAG: hypothetical protein CMP23_04130 [Rickettsiales bacterium]|nr:hypothetical protein [Rickettsiales bacterium]|tara:strand:- start:1573 stop:2163 length:591 start_codon:yes stop_codon:yes gene_type:complete
MGSACTYEGPIIEGWEEGGVGCEENSNPRIGSWFLSSAPVLLADGTPGSQYALASHFAWRDPSPPENEDPQNMVGGWISMELEDGESSIPYIDSDWLVAGCPAGQQDTCAALEFPNSQTGCSGANCRDGWLTLPLTSPDGLFVEGASFHVVVRVRDRCGAASNERSTYERGRYVIGSGKIEITAPIEEPSSGETDG